MRKRTRKTLDCQVKIRPSDKISVGFDVHKKSIDYTVRLNGSIHRQGVMPTKLEAVDKLLDPLRPGLRVAVFEAGPTGFGIPRALVEAGYPVIVCAPGKTPRPANPQAKCDRLDGATLALYAERGLLKTVAIPTRQQEIDRQVLRLREQLIKKQRRIKQQIKSFLLYYGIQAPSSWSMANRRHLSRIELGPELRFTLDVYLDELEHLLTLVKRTEREMMRLGRTDRHRRKQQQLRTHPGVGPITAMTFLAEVYRPQRFDNRCQLTAYLGLAPRVRQSGNTRRDGPLIKAGRGALRRMLVQAAWRWVARDAEARTVYQRLVGNTGSGQKAIIGMARRMAVNLWCMITREQVYRQRVA